jgi:flagellar motility protein MotE (MotC chaperone)
MTKLLQFMGGFILSFLLIVGLFTGIFWFTKDYTPPPPPGVNMDSLAAIGLWPDSASVYDSERYHLQELEKELAQKQDSITYREQVVAQREALLAGVRQKITSAGAVEDSLMDLRYTDIAQLIENMKPVDSGPVMDQLSDLAAAKILVKMRKRQAGRVMNVMDVNKVAQVSQLITLLKK